MPPARPAPPGPCRRRAPAAAAGLVGVLVAALGWPAVERLAGARAVPVDDRAGTGSLRGHRAALGIAHNAGNRAATLGAAVRAGADVVEVDVVEVARRLHAGRVHGPAGLGTPLFRGPALADVWHRARAVPAVQLDLKQDHDGFAERVGAFLATRPGPPRALVSSPSADVLRRVRLAAPGARTVLSVPGPGELSALLRRPAALRDVDGVSVHHRLLDGPAVRALAGGGRLVLAWTVNDPRRAGALLRAGVHGVSTDNPSILRALAGPGDAGGRPAAGPASRDGPGHAGAAPTTPRRGARCAAGCRP